MCAWPFRRRKWVGVWLAAGAVGWGSAFEAPGMGGPLSVCLGPFWSCISVSPKLTASGRLLQTYYQPKLQK